MICSAWIETAWPSASWMCLLVLSVVLLGILKLTWPDRVLSQLPHYTLYPVIGNLPVMPASLTDVVPTMNRWCRDLQSMAYLHIFHYNYVLISSPEAAEPVLSSRTLLAKGVDYDPVRPWFGSGLLTSSGAKWFKHRKLITPAFHFAILDEFLKVMNEQSKVLVRRLHSSVRDTDGQVDVWPLISDVTLDIICETAMGVKLGVQLGLESKYHSAMKEMSALVFQRSIKPWLRSDLFYSLSGLKKRQDTVLRTLLNFSSDVIEMNKRRRKMESVESRSGDQVPAKKRLAFLDLMLKHTEEGNSLTDEDIRNEVDTFIFEGHDTTSCGINWALYNIGRFPEVQQKIHKELQDIFGDSNRPPNREDLSQMKYLECVIKESLRLFPPVPLFSRKTESPVKVLGKTIPINTYILLYSLMIHRDPNHWPNPERFDPDRFTKSKTVDRHPYSYLPFSAGVRNCIGQRYAMMEQKTILSHILRNFCLESCEKLEEVKFLSSMTLQKSGPLEMRVLSRR